MVSIPCCIDHLKTQPAWIIFLSSLAFFSIFMKCMLILQWVSRTFIRPAKDLKIYGSWALVTGSTDGTGVAFVFKLAEKGLNLVLVSRNPCRLKQISGQIEAKYPEIAVEILELEFSSALAVSRVDGALKEMIQGLDMINNEGITYPGAMYFHEVSENVWMNFVKVNVLSTTYVTKAVIRGMISRGRGAIVNIGSGAAIVIPSHTLYAIYAAPKRTIICVNQKGIKSCICGEIICLYTNRAQQYVEAAIRQIGYESRGAAPLIGHIPSSGISPPSCLIFFSTLGIFRLRDDVGC